jgi:hypothetical protein
MTTVSLTVVRNLPTIGRTEMFYPDALSLFQVNTSIAGL